MKKHIAILGSTGSIGTQTLEVLEHHPEHFELEVLTANNNAEVLVQQARKHLPNHVVIANEEKYPEVREALSELPVKVYAGRDALSQVLDMPSIHQVVTALVGFAGLEPTLKAVETGKDLALANKETLVVGGELVTQAAAKSGVGIYPVDSEHSAIFQCLAGESMNPIEKIILTASGGPFLGADQQKLERVTPDEALQHPNWCMGEKVTIDSASLMNKGLEVIEAHWLFSLKPEQIDVVIHPQSIVHSMVQFRDGSVKAQLGIPDMRGPIQYALGYPHRLPNQLKRFSVTDYPNLSFQMPDRKTFRNLSLAYEALERGGNVPCVMNAANEIVVQAFLNRQIRFTDMPAVIQQTMNKASFISSPSLQDYIDSDDEARKIAQGFVFE
jgi:1-deoxy-D-xylulose-5-phosphate reductoisomerase